MCATYIMCTRLPLKHDSISLYMKTHIRLGHAVGNFHLNRGKFTIKISLRNCRVYQSMIEQTMLRFLRILRHNTRPHGDIVITGIGVYSAARILTGR